MALNIAMSKKLTPRQHAAVYRLVVKLAGGRPRDLVAKLGHPFYPQHVNAWKKRGFSEDACNRIVALFPGQITCHQMRPDLFPAPEAIAA